MRDLPKVRGRFCRRHSFAQSVGLASCRGQLFCFPFDNRPQAFVPFHHVCGLVMITPMLCEKSEQPGYFGAQRKLAYPHPRSKSLQCM